MQQTVTNYSTRDLPWHALQKALAEELEDRVRDGGAELPLRSWLARALSGATAVPQRC